MKTWRFTGNALNCRSGRFSSCFPPRTPGRAFTMYFDKSMGFSYCSLRSPAIDKIGNVEWKFLRRIDKDRQRPCRAARELSASNILNPLRAMIPYLPRSHRRRTRNDGIKRKSRIYP
jgi:hypothetical protein